MQWTLIVNGRVHEMTGIDPAGRFNPALQWVPVPSGVAPAQGWSYAGGIFTAPLAPAGPTLAQQAAAAINAGLTLTLSGSLTLAATLFPTDPTTTSKISDMAAMAARGVLPLGATDYPMKDSAGTWRHFTAAQYQAVAGAIAAYAGALNLIADGNPLGATTLPPASATVALT